MRYLGFVLWNGATSNYLAPKMKRFLTSSQFTNEETEVETVGLASNPGSLEGVMDGVEWLFCENMPHAWMPKD